MWQKKGANCQLEAARLWYGKGEMAFLDWKARGLWLEDLKTINTGFGASQAGHYL
jgi:hypothetical protein